MRLTVAQVQRVRFGDRPPTYTVVGVDNQAVDGVAQCRRGIGLTEHHDGFRVPRTADGMEIGLAALEYQVGQIEAEMQAGQPADIVGVVAEAHVGGAHGRDGPQGRRSPRRGLQGGEPAPGQPAHPHGAIAPGRARQPGGGGLVVQPGLSGSSQVVPPHLPCGVPAVGGEQSGL